jgi:Tol biopolymer transport system component/tRNA A-37 threonylcarbamoyl transferase component Bud32
MDPERWKEIDGIVQQVLGQPPADRPLYLENACAGNLQLRRDVDTVLDHLLKVGTDSLTKTLQEEIEKLAIDLSRRDAPELQPGCYLASYRIEALLGRGGMGVVYLAQDEKLRRRVAIKVLAPGMFRDDEARRHFLKEARVLAQLSHPNILTIHDVNCAENVDFIVMEWIEGSTLKELIRPHGLDIERVLKYAIQVADALALAHARGIIHRDLKPSNVMVTDAGLVKVLDFGLAKIVRPAGVDDSTLGFSTSEGKIVGTAAYMSPEQAQARKLDSRSDIFSFGSMLYEMVSGQRAFTGDSAQSVIEAIVSAEPVPLGEQVPVNLRKAIERCLRKDPERRFHSIADVRVELEEVKEETDSRALKVAENVRALEYGWTKKAWFHAALIAAVCLAGMAVWRFWPVFEVNPTLSDFELVQVTSTAGWEGQPAISPDGGRIAYSSNESGNLDIYVTDIRGHAHRPLTDDPADDTDPAWFPDGSAVAFTSERGGRTAIWKTGAEGGGATLLLDDAVDPAISSDRDQPRIAFARISPTGYRIEVAPLDNPSSVRVLTADPDGAVMARNPAWSPDNRMICYEDRQELWIVDASGGKPRQITFDGEYKCEPVWSSDGRHIYFFGYVKGAQALWRISSGGDKLQRVTNGTGEEAHPSISRDGKRLVYATNKTNYRVELLDRQSGRRNVLPESDWLFPALSPDGSKIVLVSMRPGAQEDLWLQPVLSSKPSGPPKQLMRLGGIASHPTFSPDGRWVACYRILKNKREIWTLPLSGEPAIQFTRDPPSAAQPAWSPDGLMIAYAALYNTGSEIWVAPVKEGRPAGPARRLAAGNYFARAPGWSPDSSMVAFTAWDKEQNEVWLVPARGGAPAFKLTDGAEARYLRWDATSRDILVSGCWGENRVTLRNVNPKNGASTPYQPEVEFGSRSSVEAGFFDISADGRQLVFSRVDPVGHVWMFNATKSVF